MGPGPQFRSATDSIPLLVEDRTQKFARVVEQRAARICAKQTHGDAAARTCQHARDEAANGAHARWQCRSSPSARAGMHPRISCTCLACTDCCCSAPGKQVTHPLFIARLRRSMAIYASSMVAQQVVCTPSKREALETRERRARALGVRLLSQHLVLRVLREARLRVHGRPVEAEARVFCVAGESLASVARVGGAGSRGVGRKGVE